MKWTIFFTFAALVSLSLLAWFMIPEQDNKDRTPLKWVTDSNPQRDPQVDTFNKLNPDCNLSIDPDNTGVMKVVVQCSAGMGPDLIDGVNEQSIQIYVDAGILMDVTEEANRMGFGLNTLPETVRPLVVEKVLTKDGKYIDRQFCYPCNVYHTYILYNKNIFDKLKIPYPDEDLTWDEYIRLGKLITKYTDNPSVPDVFGAAGTSVSVIAWQKGGFYFNEWGTVCEVDSDIFVDAYEMYHKMIFEYDIEPSPLQKAGVSSQGGWGGGYMNWFAEGKLGMYWGARWMLIQLRRFISDQTEKRNEWIKNNPDKDPSECPIEVVRIGTVQVPRFKDGTRYTHFGARSTGINAKTHHPEKALKFLAYLAGPEYSALINEGADSKPGNKNYISMEHFRHPDYPDEEEMHLMSIKAIPHGRTYRRSPFITTAGMLREMNKISQKILSDKSMTRDDIANSLKNAAKAINTEIARNISRNKKSQQIYRALLKSGAKPIRFQEMIKNVNLNEENK
jgi:ABC-type glycerol-3-phosphate transport system substrate-binding protein